MRAIIHESEQIVALDTNIARELCYSQPAWVNVFNRMRDDGYHFCLSDILLAEFLNQFESGRITPQQYQASMAQIDTFISWILPVLPGKRQLYQMTGIHDGGLPYVDGPEFTRAYSQAIWNWMRDLSTPVDFTATIATFEYAGQQYQCPFQAGTVGAKLQAERDQWSSLVHQFDNMPQDRLHEFREQMLIKMRNTVDSWAICTPPMSVRLDLWLKFLLETIVQRTQSVGAYNPDSKRRRNDSIDALLKLTFLLPGFVCTLDRRYIARFDPIDSFQKFWIQAPDDLSHKWTNGIGPVTVWPD